MNCTYNHSPEYYIENVLTNKILISDENNKFLIASNTINSTPAERLRVMSEILTDYALIKSSNKRYQQAIEIIKNVELEKTKTVRRIFGSPYFVWDETGNFEKIVRLIYTLPAERLKVMGNVLSDANLIRMDIQQQAIDEMINVDLEKAEYMSRVLTSISLICRGKVVYNRAIEIMKQMDNEQDSNYMSLLLSCNHEFFDQDLYNNAVDVMSKVDKEKFCSMASVLISEPLSQHPNLYNMAIKAILDLKQDYNIACVLSCEDLIDRGQDSYEIAVKAMYKVDQDKKELATSGFDNEDLMYSEVAQMSRPEFTNYIHKELNNRMKLLASTITNKHLLYSEDGKWGKAVEMMLQTNDFSAEYMWYTLNSKLTDLNYKQYSTIVEQVNEYLSQNNPTKLNEVREFCTKKMDFIKNKR